MTSFMDGPAKGQHLMLKLSPAFLRVVVSCGKWDALDRPEDEPQPTEKIYAYKLSEIKGHCHINAGRGRGGFYPITEYRYIEAQPADFEMRGTGSWRRWCAKQEGCHES